jgi:hypothetical protein
VNRPANAPARRYRQGLRYAADSIVGVQGSKHLVAGKRGTHRHKRGVFIAHLTYEYDIGILAHQRFHAAEPVQPGTFAHVGLADKRKLVFHRVFQRHDIGVDIVDVAEDGIKRGGFTATCWAGYDNDSLRALEEFFKYRNIMFGKTEVLQRNQGFRLIEQASLRYFHHVSSAGLPRGNPPRGPARCRKCGHPANYAIPRCSCPT